MAGIWASAARAGGDVAAAMCCVFSWDVAAVQLCSCARCRGDGGVLLQDIWCHSRLLSMLPWHAALAAYQSLFGRRISPPGSVCASCCSIGKRQQHDSVQLSLNAGTSRSVVGQTDSVESSFSFCWCSRLHTHRCTSGWAFAWHMGVVFAIDSVSQTECCCVS